MRSCARWRRRPIAASATTAARLTSSCASPTSKGCSGGGEYLLAFSRRRPVGRNPPRLLLFFQRQFPFRISDETVDAAIIQLGVVCKAVCSVAFRPKQPNVSLLHILVADLSRSIDNGDVEHTLRISLVRRFRIEVESTATILRQAKTKVIHVGKIVQR